MTGHDLALPMDQDYLRAFAGGLILALGMAPLGVFLSLRRMTLMGDAIAHGVMPGVAIAILVAGMSASAMALGGLIAGLALAWVAGFVSRSTGQGEETSLAALYLCAFALGALLLSLGPARGEELSHVLFGTARPLTQQGLLQIAAAASLVALALAIVWPALVLDVADPDFLRSVSRAGPIAHGTLLALVVAMLVAAFQAVGTLLSVGLLVLPAASARYWTDRLTPMILIAAAIGAVANAGGLLIALATGAPAGPCVVLLAGGAYLISVALGPNEGLVARHWPRRHYAG